MNEYRVATPEQKKAKEFEESLEKRYEAIGGEQKKIRAQFIKDNPTSLVSMYVLQRYDLNAPEYTEVAPLFNGLSDAVKNNESRKAYTTLLNTLKATSIDGVAHEFTKTDTLVKRCR